MEITYYGFQKLDRDTQAGVILDSITGENHAIIASLCMDEWGSIQDIKNRFDNYMEGYRQVPSVGSINWFMELTLLPRGEAERKRDCNHTKREVNLYRLSKLGREYTQPAAAHAIAAACEFNESALNILGRPFTREGELPKANGAIIMKKLFIGEENEDALEKAIGAESSIFKRYLRGLMEIGFISYESTETKTENGGWSRYRWIDSEPEYVRGTRNARRIARYLYERRVDRKFYNYKDIIGDLGICKSLVCTALPELERSGFLERRGFAVRSRKSRIQLTATGELFVERFIDPFYQSLEDRKYRTGEYGEAVEELREKAKVLCPAAHRLFVGSSGNYAKTLGADQDT